MSKKVYVCKNLEDLETMAKEILPILKEKKFLLLDGELGAGKTALVKKIAKLIGIKSHITSPSFNYMKVYEGLVHIDAYNFKGSLLEFEDYFEDNIVAIEWASKISFFYQNYLFINVLVNNSNHHIYEIKEIK